jgi:two-component system CheB/CheR fusion protein
MTDTPSKGNSMSPFPIVGIGASAGGLEALETFFEHVPEDCGQAFVVVQHLSPDFKSVMDQLLARRTSLVVERVEDGVEVRPGAIYLIPPKKEMIISGGRLLLSDKDPTQSLSLPIDTFFRSLAQDAGERAIAVVLSGTGSDGSRGIRDVHEAGGMVVVQTVDSAKFDGMPKSAIDTGIVDLQLPPEQIHAAIERYCERGIHGAAASAGDAALEGVDKIISLLHREYGLDFALYKPTTLHRRIERRLIISQATSLESYARTLSEDRRELHQLYKDLLIGVTRFFRDAEAFRALRQQLVRDVLPQLKDGGEFRIWSAGCATGEEAYSLAILLHDLLDASKRKIDVKIFATDVHAASLESASAGVFTGASLEGLEPKYLERYFTPTQAGFRVVQDLRQMIVFAPHNLLKDAPFTKMDLITCRNMLIYLEPAAQKKVLTLFHFAMKPRGLLMMGLSETPGDLADEFETVDLHSKLFRKSRDVRLHHDVRLAGGSMYQPPSAARADRATEGDRWLATARERLLDEFAPPSLLVDDAGNLVHTFAGGGRYLTLADGKSSLCVLDLVPPDLKVVLNGALQRAAKEQKRVDYVGVPFRSPDGPVDLRVTVTPLELDKRQPPRFLVGFEPRARVVPAGGGEQVDMGDESRDRIGRLEEELQYTRENLQATLEEMETSNEELQATNEELVASNEELQSTNEELQSVNEELYTVNSEYQRKIVELTELNADIDNLLVHTDVGVIFLDRDLRIRKFTPQMERTFHLAPGDIGRRLESFAHTLDDAHLLDDVVRVRDAGEPVQREVRDRAGVSYLLRIVPYRKATGQTDGVVVSLVDVSMVRATEAELRRMSRVFQDGADPIIIEDLSGVIIDLNDEAARAYGYDRSELIGKPAVSLMPAELSDDGTRLRERCLLREHIRNVETARMTKDGRRVPVLLTLSLITDEAREPAGIATIAKDVSKLKWAEEAANDAVRRRDEFLALLSHELRNPLSAVLNASRVVTRSLDDPERLKGAADSIDRQAWHMARLLDDLLDVSRVTSGKIHLRKEPLDWREIIGDTAESMGDVFEGQQQTFHLELPDEPVYVDGDRARLYQVAENLLSNASKYTPREGRIEMSLTVERAAPAHGNGQSYDGAALHDGEKFDTHLRDGLDYDSCAVLRVRDNGSGIEPALLPHVFDMFTQSERTLARSDGGMGVGLTLVRNLVALHGGDIKAQSDGPRRGSMFTVKLPLTTRRPASMALVSSAGSEPRRVLIVEDNADARKTLALLLKMEGHEVAQAPDGESGLAALVDSPPDVALVDIGLPRIDGLEVARRARANPNLAEVVLVAVTGYGQDSDHKAIVEAGFDEHLVKPIGSEQLAAVLSRYARQG